MQKELKKVDELQAHQQELRERMRNKIGERIQALNDAYKNKDGEAIDKANTELFELLEPVKESTPFYTQMKNHTWQKNHLRILGSINSLIQDLGRMPTNTEISQNAGLSEETTYKHLKEFKEHDLFKHEADKFYLMKDRVLAVLFDLASKGDVKACKVFLDYTTNNTIQPTPPQPTTNYIQINNLKITTDELERLPVTTLQKIETLIKKPTNR